MHIKKETLQTIKFTDLIKGFFLIIALFQNNFAESQINALTKKTYKSILDNELDTPERYAFANYYVTNYPDNPKVADSLLKLNSNYLRSINHYDFLAHELSRINLLYFFYDRRNEAIQLIIDLNYNYSFEEYTYLNGSFNVKLGNILYEMKKPGQAIENFKKSLDCSIEMKDSTFAKGSLINIGTCFDDLEQYDSAIVYYEKAYELEDAGIMDYQDALANNLAESYANTNQLILAITLAESLLERHIEQNNSDRDPLYFANLGRYYIDQNLFDKSEQLLDNAEEYAQSSKFRNDLLLIYGSKINLYTKQKNYKKALKYTLLKIDLEQQIETEANDEQFNKLRNDYEAEKSLEKEKQSEQKLAQEKELLRFLYLFAALLSLVVIVLLIYILRSKRANVSLVKTNLEIVEKEKARNALNPKKIRQSIEASEEVINQIRVLLYEQKLFKDPKISIKVIASKTESNTTFISNIINDHFAKSFPELLNALRIDEARILLSDSNFDHYSIQGIGETVGYKSVSSFNLNFKKITGITPSYYRKEVQRINS